MTALTRFTWELEVMGPKGPPSATMRLVLLVIGSHVRKRGSVECFPSIRRLEQETQLSTHTVVDAIKDAVQMGWLGKRTGMEGGMTRRGSIYKLRLPEIVPTLVGEVDDEDGVINLRELPTAASSTAQSYQQHTATAATDTALGSGRALQSGGDDRCNGAMPTAAIDAPLTTYRSKKEIKEAFEVDLRTSFSSSLEKSEGQQQKLESQNRREENPNHGGVRVWAASNGIQQGSGESDRDFIVRAGLEYARSLGGAR